MEYLNVETKTIMSQASKELEGAETISKESRVQENSKRPAIGKVCKKCGEYKNLSEFYTRRIKCKKCVLEESRDYYKKNRDKIRKSNNISVAKYTKKNRERENKRTLKYYYNNIEERKGYSRKWRKEKPHLHAAKEGKRRAAKRKAVPAWANIEKIKDIYKIAKEKGMHVDHIVPLQSDIVCGLHCEDNLQLLSPTENLQKSNRLMI